MSRRPSTLAGRRRWVQAGAAGRRCGWPFVQQQQGHVEAAEALYLSALGAADPNSGDAADILELHAQLLEKQGRGDEAKPLRARANEIRVEQAVQEAANQNTSSDALKIGGEVHPPSLKAKMEPSYSQDARLAQYQGTILLAIEVGVDGVAQNIRVVRSLGFGPDQKAIEAIRQWQFNPATQDGQPVKVMANVEVNFRLL